MTSVCTEFAIKQRSWDFSCICCISSAVGAPPTASVAGLTASDPRVVKTVAYNATKHGLVGLTRQCAAEWGEHGITVNAICPGFFPSRMTRATLGTTGELIRDWTPTRRLGNDEDLKGLVVLLASEASRHITGQAIAVDGGATVI